MSFESDANLQQAVKSVEIERLIVALSDHNLEISSNAAENLGKSGDAKAVEPLFNSSKNGEEFLRPFATYALRHFKETRVIEFLIASLKDKNEHVREAAVIGLGQISDDRAIEPLITTLQEKSIPVGEAAVIALSSFGDSILPRLLHKSKNDNTLVCNHIVNILINLGTAIVPSLINALQDEDSGIRLVAAKAVGFILEPETITPLIVTLKDSHNAVRLAAADGLLWMQHNYPDIHFIDEVNETIRLIKRPAKT